MAWRKIILFLLITGSTSHFKIAAQSDSVKILDEVTVKGYRSNRPLMLVPASIGVVDSLTINRFNNTSLLSAVNTVAGVRMEERSPGSYRFSIRGSLLRSPFGVRNVKFYWNGLPLTDGGGNTYLNLIDPDAIHNIEIIKGPGASLYGAGTGGVVLLNSTSDNLKKQIDYSVLTGSYGLFKIGGGGNVLASDKSVVTVRALYQRADGYREHTEMKRYSSFIDWRYLINTKGVLSTTVFTSNLFYQTPGGLTKEQYDDNPKQARPATQTIPGAVEQNASVKNNTTYLGLKYEHSWSNTLKTDVGAFTSITAFKNPAIRNYELRDEVNIGGRVENEFQFRVEDVSGRWLFGGEFQHFNSPVSVYDNELGKRGALQLRDRINSTSGLVFSQLEFELPSFVYLTAGLSYNFLAYKFVRTSDDPNIRQNRIFEPAFYPRLALLKNFGTISIFGSISSGFSPPSVAEVRPSTNTFNSELDAETGVNLELGFRGKLFNNHLSVDVVGYDMNLQNTIVIKRDEDGAEFFVNAGETKQRGLEAKVVYARSNVNVWTSYTLNDFFFEQYVQDGNNYSGNRLTGTAPHVVVFGFDVEAKNGLYKKTTITFTDKMPLHDSNLIKAPAFWLAGLKVGYKKTIKKITYDLFGTIDNLFDARYSLGYDLNAIGGRYYNAAPGVNFSVGLKMLLQ
jgi:iron complex outermembrane recepter protein